jgi:hypothetical protein
MGGIEATKEIRKREAEKLMTSSFVILGMTGDSFSTEAGVAAG